jgi:uncharacterized protein YjiS (DUF1127 family)
METTWSRPIPVSRAAWLRIGDGVLDSASSALSTLRQLWSRWQAARRCAAEFRALRELSPNVLRDIGAEPQTIHQAQHWSEQHDVARDAFLRGL